jgi:asparagine synthetase B (glutamine-hydrolysing)
LAKSRPSSKTISDDALLRTYHELLTRAIRLCTAEMKAPWLLQSGGKDSTSLAIAIADARPDTTCITYLGGEEENEVASASYVARQLGLRHESLVCDPGRAYDRYLAMVPRMPLLTADFALLSYADLVTEIKGGGDGVLDGLGADPYFGAPLPLGDRLLIWLALGVNMPEAVFKLPVVHRHFKLCFALGTLQMNWFERYFPGSRFSDTEVDKLFGRPVSAYSRKRMEAFKAELRMAQSVEAVRRIVLVILEAQGFAKGMYPANAMNLRMAYPHCDKRLSEWVFNQVPDDRLMGPGGVNKVLMRRYIAQHFTQLPYVRSKGSFRFNVRGLASQRFEQVHAFASQARALLPGAKSWLEDHRHCLDNKFFASKFYLLAVTMPWLLRRLDGAAATTDDGEACSGNDPSTGARDTCVDS